MQNHIGSYELPTSRKSNQEAHSRDLWIVIRRPEQVTRLKSLKA
jgi:hypothetical protein